MRGLIESGLELRWVTQATTALAQKPELLALAQKSGCVGVLIGFESLSQESLREADKSYKAAVGATAACSTSPGRIRPSGPGSTSSRSSSGPA